MAPIVADCLQVTIQGACFGNTWANVFHVQKLGAASSDPLGDATLFAADFESKILPKMSSGCTLSTCSYADLSSLSGLSGNFSITGTGGGSGTMLAPNTAVLCSWSALGTRAQRNGRSYFIGVDEDQVTSDGKMTTTYQGEWQTAVDDFIDELQADDLGLVVLSRTGASSGDVRTVLDGNVQQLLATQRRRLRR